VRFYLFDADSFSAFEMGRAKRKSDGQEVPVASYFSDYR